MACATLDLESELLQGERLLLRTIRLLALRAACPALRRLFDDACGCGGGEAYGALAVMMQQLGVHGRRRIDLAPPGGQPTADERVLLEAFARAQVDDYRGLEASLEDLSGAEAPASMGAAACVVAEVFAMAGLMLPLRSEPLIFRFAAE